MRYGAKWCVYDPPSNRSRVKLAPLGTKEGHCNTITAINRRILTAMRVCEDALRYKMIRFLGGKGRFGLGEVQT